MNDRPTYPGRSSSSFRLGWAMVAIAFLAQNCAIGVTFGGFGTLVAPIAAKFGTSRGLASAGLSMASLTLGLASSIVGTLLQRVPIRSVMLVGAAASAAGYVVLAAAPNIFVLLAAYGLLIGPGAAALAIVPGSALVSRWFVHRRGTALGIVNTLLFVFLMPLVSTFVLLGWGLRAVFLVNAAIFVALVPILLLIVEAPARKGLRPLGAAETPEGHAAAPAAALAIGSVLRLPAFWLLSLGIAMLTGPATMLTVHLAPMIHDQGFTLSAAAGALSAYGLALSAGALATGASVDRVGPFRAALICTAMLVVTWTTLLLAPPSLPGYLVLSGILGLASGGITTIHSAAAAALFDSATFSRALGLGYVVKIPFLFAAAPAGGYVYDVTGSYAWALTGGIVTLLFAGCLFLALMGVARKGQRRDVTA